MRSKTAGRRGPRTDGFSNGKGHILACFRSGKGLVPNGTRPEKGFSFENPWILERKPSFFSWEKFIFFFTEPKMNRTTKIYETSNTPQNTSGTTSEINKIKLKFYGILHSPQLIKNSSSNLTRQVNHIRTTRNTSKNYKVTEKQDIVPHGNRKG